MSAVFNILKDQPIVRGWIKTESLIDMIDMHVTTVVYCLLDKLRKCSKHKNNENYALS